MENQEEQYNSSEEFEDDSERDKKKKARILIFIEMILLGLVVVLAIIFFSNRGGNTTLVFNGGDSNQPSGQVNSGDINVNENVNNTVGSNTNNNNSNVNNQANNPDVTTVDRGETEYFESLRLSLPVPDQSPVSTEDQIPEGAIVVDGLDSGFSPSEFSVSPGQEITLALVSRIKYPVVLTFYNPNMAAISIGCGPYETRWVTFNAPSEPGEYEFRNDVFGRTSQTGKMIVR